MENNLKRSVLFILAGIALALLLMIGYQMVKPSKAGTNASTPTEPSPVVSETPLPQPDKPAAVTIDLGQYGFSPKEVTIKKGDVIKFTGSRGDYFWPASDLHPTHLLYPEFDPKEPLEASASWSFQFNKVGEWRFHDHLNPLYTGTVTVKE